MRQASRLEVTSVTNSSMTLTGLCNFQRAEKHTGMGLRCCKRQAAANLREAETGQRRPAFRGLQELPSLQDFMTITVTTTTITYYYTTTVIILITTLHTIITTTVLIPFLLRSITIITGQAWRFADTSLRQRPLRAFARLWRPLEQQALC